MDHINIYIFKLQLAERLPTSPLDIVVVRVPELSVDEKLFARHSSCNALLKGFTNFFLVLVDLSSIDVTISMLQDGRLYCLNRYLSVSECSEADDWNRSAII